MFLSRHRSAVYRRKRRFNSRPDFVKQATRRRMTLILTELIHFPNNETSAFIKRCSILITGAALETSKSANTGNVISCSLARKQHFVIWLFSNVPFYLLLWLFIFCFLWSRRCRREGKHLADCHLAGALLRKWKQKKNIQKNRLATWKDARR